MTRKIFSKIQAVLGISALRSNFFMLSLSLCAPVFADDAPLFLITKIPIKILSIEPKMDSPYEPFSYGKHGFINAGKSVYFGDGCWTFNLKEKALRCDLPRSLNSVNIGDDGRWLYGCVGPKDGSGAAFWLDTLLNTKKNPKPSCSSYLLNGKIDRSGRIIATPTRPRGGGNDYASVDLYFIDTDKSIEGKPFKGGYNFRPFLGFSIDGKSLLFTSTSDFLGIVDAKTLKLRAAISPPFIYFVAGHSGNVVAGLAAIVNPETGDVPDFKEKSMTSVWDLKQRKYLWKENSWGQALAFSPDDQYLLTTKHVVNLKTGEIVGSNYIGTEGKISPDNKTLLTKDDQFFYIYKIGKD